MGWAAWAVPHAAEATAAASNSLPAESTTSASTPTAGASASSTPTATATPSAAATTAAAAPVAYGGYTGTVAGDAVSMRYGIVQVQVALNAGVITDVTVLQAPSTGKDMMYTNRAVPVLHDEAVAAQSANISIVSGASFTSQAYIQSLQSALDQL